MTESDDYLLNKIIDVTLFVINHRHGRQVLPKIRVNPGDLFLIVKQILLNFRNRNLKFFVEVIC